MAHFGTFYVESIVVVVEFAGKSLSDERLVASDFSLHAQYSEAHLETPQWRGLLPDRPHADRRPALFSRHRCAVLSRAKHRFGSLARGRQVSRQVAQCI